MLRRRAGFLAADVLELVSTKCKVSESVGAVAEFVVQRRSGFPGLLSNVTTIAF